MSDEIICSGIIPVRLNGDGKLEYLLGKIGGPYGRGIRSFSMIKGCINNNEDLKDAAIREFYEETGFKFADDSRFMEFGYYRTTHKKNYVYVYISSDIEKDIQFKQQIIEIEYPKGTGKIIKIPEIEYVKYLTFEEAMIKCKSNSFVTLLEALEKHLIASRLFLFDTAKMS